jgi:hypothetical protein
MAQAREYFVTDGDLILRLKPTGRGWFHVQAIFEPEVVTRARSLSQAFETAYQARKQVRAARRKLFVGAGRRTRNRGAR